MKRYSLDYFSNTALSFVLIKDGEVLYQSKSHGLKPLIFCFKKYRWQMKSAMVFDKTVGRAAALILTEAKIKKIITPLISVEAINILKNAKIETEFGKKVKHILNRAGDDLCQMEKLSAGKNCEDFFKVMRALRFLKNAEHARIAKKF